MDSRTDLCFQRRMFPFIPDGRDIIGGMAILIGRHAVDHSGCGCECFAQKGCPCPEHRGQACETVEFHHGDFECDAGIRVECIANEAWPNFHFGTVKTMIEPIAKNERRDRVQLRFSAGAKGLDHLFLLCRYAPISDSACGCHGNEWARSPMKGAIP